MFSILCFIGIILWNFYMTFLYNNIIYVTFLIIEILMFTAGVIQLCVLSQKVDIELCPTLPAADIGQEVCCILKVSNRSAFPLVYGRVDVDYVNTFTGERHKLRRNLTVCAKTTGQEELPIVSRQCGIVKIRVRKAVISDLTGFLCVSKKKKTETDVLFLPKIVDMDIDVDRVLLNFIGDSDEYDKNHPGDDPSELFEVRGYREGDRMQRIHWRATAKTDSLMVKEFSKPLACGLIVLADMSIGESAVWKNADSYMTVLLSYSLMLIEKGVHHYVAWYDAKDKGIMRQVIHNVGDVYVLMNSIMRSGPYKELPDLENLYQKSYQQDTYMKAYTFSTDCIMRERGVMLWSGTDLKEPQETVL